MITAPQPSCLPLDETTIGNEFQNAGYKTHLGTTKKLTMKAHERYPIRLGLQTSVITAPQPSCLPLDEVTIGDEMRAAGYHTHIGFSKKGFYELSFFLGQNKETIFIFQSENGISAIIVLNVCPTTAALIVSAAT